MAALAQYVANSECLTHLDALVCVPILSFIRLLTGEIARINLEHVKPKVLRDGPARDAGRRVNGEVTYAPKCEFMLRDVEQILDQAAPREAASH